MRCHLTLDKGFLKFLKDKKDITKIAIVLALGLILIFIGSTQKNTVDTEQDIEQRIESACSGVEGVGRCSVLVYYAPSDSRIDAEEKIESVIVICDGADSVEVRLTLTEMLSSFFGIGANRIRVEKMKE